MFVGERRERASRSTA